MRRAVSTVPQREPFAINRPETVCRCYALNIVMVNSFELNVRVKYGYNVYETNLINKQKSEELDIYSLHTL